MKKIFLLSFFLATVSYTAAAIPTTTLTSPSGHCKVTSFALGDGYGYNIFVNVQRYDKKSGKWQDSWWNGAPLKAQEAPVTASWNSEEDSGTIQLYARDNKQIMLADYSGNRDITHISSPNYLICT